MSRFEQAQREQLEQLKAELSARVSRTHRHLHEREHAISAKFDEQVIEMAAGELVHNLDSGGRDELRRIEKALERLSEGIYGVCTSCGEDIPVPRLEAVPYAEECIDCAATDTE